jgi:hypothetical protein
VGHGVCEFSVGRTCWVVHVEAIDAGLIYSKAVRWVAVQSTWSTVGSQDHKRNSQMQRTKPVRDVQASESTNETKKGDRVIVGQLGGAGGAQGTHLPRDSGLLEKCNLGRAVSLFVT